MKKLSIAVIVLLCMVGNSFALTKVGTTAAQFLKIGVGSRAQGMGGAFVAVSDDISAIYWNPAGIANLKGSEAMFMHSEWLADISYDFGAVVLNLGSYGAVGISLSATSMAEMKVRTEIEPEGTGEWFDAGDIAAALTYARALTDRFSIGGNVKWIRQSIWHMAANTVAFDVGTLFRTQFDGMTIGMSISNFGGTLTMGGRDAREYADINPSAEGSNDQIPSYLQMDSWALPITFRVGVAWNPIETYRNRVTLAVDAIHPNDNSESINVGFEYAYSKKAFIRFGWEGLFLEDDERGGVFSDSDNGLPTNIGAGVNIPISGIMALKFDYAYADFGRLENAQRFTVSLEF